MGSNRQPKRLAFLAGLMVVCKSTASRRPKRTLPRCAVLDRDWCLAMDPFVTKRETQAMVLDNTRHMLNSFLA